MKDYKVRLKDGTIITGDDFDQNDFEKLKSIFKPYSALLLMLFVLTMIQAHTLMTVSSKQQVKEFKLNLHLFLMIALLSDLPQLGIYYTMQILPQMVM